MLTLKPKRGHYVRKAKTFKLVKEIGTMISPTNIAAKHEIALVWVADKAQTLIDEHGIMPDRAIVSYINQAESEHKFQWVYGVAELQRIAQSGIAGVRETAKKAKFLRGLDDY